MGTESLKSLESLQTVRSPLDGRKFLVDEPSASQFHQSAFRQLAQSLLPRECVSRTDAVIAQALGSDGRVTTRLLIRDETVTPSLDAAIELVGDWQSHPEARIALEAFGDLSEIFVVSQVNFMQHEEADSFAEEDGIKIDVASGNDIVIKVRVVQPRGSKCPRCWNYKEHFVEELNVCTKCNEALQH